VWRKDGYCTRSLHHGRATSMPSLAPISATVTLQFSIIVVSARSSFVRLWMWWVSSSASRTLIHLLLNVSIHSYTLHCGKQFCPYLAANCRWISAPFIPSNAKKKCHCMLLALGANLSWSSHLYAMLTRHKRTTTEPHSQHVTA
jgi:hypothetical protein